MFADSATEDECRSDADSGVSVNCVVTVVM